jgi:membrane protein required for colicin V production
METYDVIMLAVLALATIFGARKGLAWQIASLSSIFASYFVAYRFRGVLAPLIQAEPPWNMFLAMLILYLGTSMGIWTVFRFVSGIIDSVKLKDFDRHAGAVLGFARGVLWCAIITLFAVTLLGDSQRRAIVRSRSGHYIARLLDRSGSLMPEELHQVLAPYIQNLDQRLGENDRFSGAGFGPGRAGEAVPGDPYGGSLPPANLPSRPAEPSGPYQANWPTTTWPQGNYETRR